MIPSFRQTGQPSEREFVIAHNLLEIPRSRVLEVLGPLVVLRDLGIVPGAGGRAVPFEFGKKYVVRHHVEGGALVAVPVGVLAGLDRTLRRDELALAEIPADELGRAPPGDDVDEIGLFFLALGGIGAVHRDAEVAHRYPRLCAFQFRIGCQSAHQAYTVEHVIPSYKSILFRPNPDTST